MDFVIAYLYQSIDNDIYMKLTEGYNFPNNANSWDDYPIKLIKSLYGLKQSRPRGNSIGFNLLNNIW